MRSENARATWDQFEAAARTSPILLRCLEAVTQGDCSREEAAIAAALWLADDRDRLLLELAHAHDTIARLTSGGPGS